MTAPTAAGPPAAASSSGGWPAELLLPAYGSSTLAEVLPSVLTHLLPAGADPALLRRGVGWTDTLGIGEALQGRTRVGVLLLDGLGAALLEAHASEAPFLTGLLERNGSRLLSTAWPSTTSTSLTSLGCGLAPGRHGVVSYQFLVPGSPVSTTAGPGVLNTLKWDTALLDPELVQPNQTALGLAAAVGVSVSTVLPAAFEGGGLTRAAFRGGRFRPANNWAELTKQLVADLSGDGPALCYAYDGAIDKVGHELGCESAAWLAKLRAADAAVAGICAALPSGAALLVLADHGMVDRSDDPDDVLDLDAEPELLEQVSVVAGEPRARLLHVLGDTSSEDTSSPDTSSEDPARLALASQVAARFAERLGERALVLTSSAAIAAGLLGPVVDPGVRRRLGDVVVLARGRTLLVRRQLDPGASSLVGYHGSLTAAESIVPLLVHRG